VLRLWHLASLDAPTVAVVWAEGFAWAARAALPLWVAALLALTAWAVYIGDRLLDARNGIGAGAVRKLRERHWFHWRHRRTLTPLAIAAACAAAWMVLALMPAVARERDTVLAAAALVYFTGVHAASDRGTRPPRLRTAVLSKEMLVGAIFTAGCALPALNRAAAPWTLAAPVAFFAALAWLNCWAIERWEADLKGACEGLMESQVSESRPGAPDAAVSQSWASCLPGLRIETWGTQLCVFTIAGLLGLIGLMLAAALAAGQPRPAVLLAAGAASALLLALLDRLRPRLTPLALRAAADLVLLTPALLVPAAWLLR
jgi:hypothetical protein